MNPSSQFSVLCPDVDLDAAFPKKTKARKPKPKSDKVPDRVLNGVVEQNIKYRPNSGIKTAKPQASNNSKKKRNSEDADLQALAFGIPKSRGGKKASVAQNKIIEVNENKGEKSKKKKKNKNNITTEDKVDEEWRKKDDGFIEMENENCLREAILQSKLEFEKVTRKVSKKKRIENSKVEKENKKVEQEKLLEKNRVEQEEMQKTKVKKKRKKPITLSLDKFNSLDPSELAAYQEQNLDVEKVAVAPKNPKGTPRKKERFFKDVEESTKRTLDKEYRQEHLKANFTKVNDEFKIQRLTSEVEKRDFEIQALRLEVDSLRSQLQEVKNRNKKLCEVISLSEMRSKGELVLEIDKVTKDKNEYSEEVARLNGELEKERTKVSQLTTELKKIQGKKRSSDSSSK